MTDPASKSSTHTLSGQVVRLHFRCHAELPIGSFLRVTGSDLWAPGTAAYDPTDATHAANNMSDHGSGSADYVANSVGINSAGTLDGPSSGVLYASSVEMVTTPEEYPIWRTRKPVAIVVNSNRNRNKTVQHHFYRYLVVSPGATSALHSHNVQQMLQSGSGSMPGYVNPSTDADDALLVSTSSEATGSTTVLQWEDPFGSLGKNRASSLQVQNTSLSGTQSNSASGVSLNSAVTGYQVEHVTSLDYQNLPYRTIDINVQTGRPIFEELEEKRLDRWNVSEDASFQPYLIREAINQENRRKLHPRYSEITDGGDSMDTTDDHRRGHITPPPPFGNNNRIFFICFHLPVVVVQNKNTGEWNASWSESILAKTEGSQILAKYDAHWIGTVTTHPPLQSEDDKNRVREILRKMNCTPLFLDPVVRQAHYYGFCKQVLWPAFHNIDLLDMSTSGWLYYDSGERQQQDPASDAAANQSDWDQSRLEDWWRAFQGVNQEFSDLMSATLKEGDICWIHDYHLALLPQKLSEWEIEKFGVKVTRKVFFLHIPFPTSQIFRELECGERILEGMLHADVVGFHAFDHARHFLNAAKRILGLNYETIAGGLIGVNFRGSTVLVSMSNVSIEPRKVDAVLSLPSVGAGQAELRRKHSGRIIIGALDIGQRLSGASLKLLAYERLLQDYPVWQNRIVMVQIMLLPGSRKSDENATIRELRSLVKRIQVKFGPEVIDYQELIGSSLPMDQRLALWMGSDILMSTPIREGLNHWPMEFIYAHKEPGTPGVVIASEFSAISSILNGALRVNPYDIQATVVIIDKALSMDMQEREWRRYRDIDFVSSSPSDKWVKNVLRDLHDAASIRVGKSGTGTSQNNSQVSTPYATPSQHRKTVVDSTASFLAREADQAFAHLQMKAVCKAYDHSKNRVLILDFNGTIVLKEPPGKYLKREILGTSGNKPPPEVIEALRVLSEDPKNLIYVVSGDSSENVLSALGHLSGIGLAVSNGARAAPPMSVNVVSVGQRNWFTFDLGVDWDAVKRVALPVLSKYTARSNGSFVKLTSFSIGWSYYSCDPEWGSMQAAYLVLELENELRTFDVRFVTLKGVVEIVPRKLNKGLVVKKILRDRNAINVNDPVDFVLCFGDDISDEKMFTSVFSFLAEQGDLANCTPIPPVIADDGTYHRNPTIPPGQKTPLPSPQYCYTVAVGKKPSHASFYVNDAEEVVKCLVSLTNGSVQETGLQWGSIAASNLFS